MAEETIVWVTSRGHWGTCKESLEWIEERQREAGKNPHVATISIRVTIGTESGLVDVMDINLETSL